MSHETETTDSKHVTFYVPTRPYSPIDALNRRAAAVGSPGYAEKAANADYNGHRITVGWNEYRGYYIAQYWWAGRHVLRRGKFQDCLDAALREHNRGALGSSIIVCPRPDDAEAIAICETHEALLAKEPPQDWLTWRHKCAAESVRDSANPGMMRLHFDWPLMQEAASEEEYRAALTAKYGNAYHFGS